MAKKNPYFDDFVEMANHSCQAAEYLQTVFMTFDPALLPDCRKKMHDIEHAADEVKHSMMTRLAKEFVTPIDREDIIHLTNELDDLTDKLDDVVIRMFMYNITQLRPAALRIAEVIVGCCKALKVAMVEFPNFHKSTSLRKSIIHVNTMEEKGDDLYIEAMQELYRKETNPIEIAVWSELFDRLEDCCDACEHVADSLEIIVMKNS